MKQGKMHQLHGHERNHVHFGFFYIFGLGHFFSGSFSPFIWLFSSLIPFLNSFNVSSVFLLLFVSYYFANFEEIP